MQKKNINEEYELALRRIFHNPDGDFIIEQWKNQILNTPSVHPQQTMELACWRGGGKDVYRDLLKIINKETK